MDFFDGVVSSLNSAVEKRKKEERRRIRGLDDYELERAYRDYLEDDNESHWMAKLLKEEIENRGLVLPRY